MPNETGRYRPLTREEIELLVQRGCRTTDGSWDGVMVSDGFDPSRLFQVTFAGQVRIGRLQGQLPEVDGIVTKAAEIVRAHLIDCCVGDNVRIANIGVHLANYDIGDGACIENVGRLEVRPQACFGNGVEVAALNEAGGREVIMFDGLSAQFAHLLCLHRHRPQLIQRLLEMAKAAAEQVHSSRGTIGPGARVSNVAEIVDVQIGPSALVDGATRLVNGTVLSDPQAPTTIGAGVEAEDFIVAEGSTVTESALLASSYVGQGCRVGRQFSAENCLFFANCEAFHGEACSVFAGPYTVTHHKSSLLIAGMFSFFNAGSGTNQSNHLYKLGPVHEGKVERGSKMGSFAYLMWPCRVGPFSVVLGKHTRPFDSSDLPFSHIEATADGRSMLIPGFNLTTVGVVRDGAKWPTRDRRRGSVRRDRISFAVFSPLTVGRMMRGLELLQQLQQTTEKSVEAVAVNGAEIKRVFLRTGQKYYRRGIHMYLADKVVARIETQWANGVTSLDEALRSSPQAVFSKTWQDLGGQLLPAARVDQLCGAIEDGQIDGVAGCHQELDRYHELYAEDEWVWVKQAYREIHRVDLDQALPSQILAAADTLLKVRTEFLNLVLIDASKEFDAQSRTGFGAATASESADADFQAVRGDFESNSFVREVRQEIESLAERVKNFKQRLAEHT